MRREVIKLSEVTVRFDGNKVLDRVDLTVYEKDFLGIIGPNGGGKTTLLKVILGLIRPDSGEVFVFGKAPREISGLIGYVPQHAHSDPQYPASVWDVVLMGRLSKGRLFRPYSRKDREIAEKALEMVQLKDLKDKQMGNLSGGQRQRVLIARALACEPHILILDEPTASLDTLIGRSFYELLQRLNEELTIVMVTHDVGVLARSVRTVACMSQKLFMHEDAQKIGPDILQKVYGCPVDLITHGDHPHRVFELHGEDEGEAE